MSEALQHWWDWSGCYAADVLPAGHSQRWPYSKSQRSSVSNMHCCLNEIERQQHRERDGRHMKKAETEIWLSDSDRVRFRTEADRQKEKVSSEEMWREKAAVINRSLTAFTSFIQSFYIMFPSLLISLFLITNFLLFLFLWKSHNEILNTWIHSLYILSASCF